MTLNLLEKLEFYLSFAGLNYLAASIHYSHSFKTLLAKGVRTARLALINSACLSNCTMLSVYSDKVCSQRDEGFYFSFSCDSVRLLCKPLYLNLTKSGVFALFLSTLMNAF